MKRILLLGAIFLLPARSGFAQTAADTGVVSRPAADSAQKIPADTAALAIPPAKPADSGAVSHPSADTTKAAPAPAAPPAPADTTSKLARPDTAAALPKVPADTTVKPAPADTGAAAAPPQKTAPADTGKAVTPPAEKVPPTPVPAVTPGAEEGAEAPKPKERNRVGFGIVFNDEAPLAIRAWLNPKVGLDLGIGLRLRTVENLTATIPSPDSTTTFLDLNFDLGLPVRAIRHDKVDFILRPGFGFRTRPEFEIDPKDPTVRSKETTIELEVNGTFGFEYYPFPRASFSLQAGMALITERAGGEIATTNIRVQSIPSEKGVNLAFRYYLF